MSYTYGKHPLLRKAVKTIHSYRMLAPNESVLAGVSGGPDSVCLLRVLLELAGEFNLRIGALHLNHGLRDRESDRDEDFAGKKAEEAGIPFFCKKIDVSSAARSRGLSVEDAGRRLRYEFCLETAARHGYDKIAVGHNSDDNAELVLMNLIRGAGPRGLSGIPPVRGKIIRPLIGVSRPEILDYIKSMNLDYVEDRSNEDTDFLRNRVRHELLPLLKKNYNPNMEETLNRLSDIFRQEEDWLEGLARDSMEKALIIEDEKRIVLSADSLAGFRTACLRRVLRSAVKKVKGDLRRISHRHISGAVFLLRSASQPARMDLPGRIRIEKEGGKLEIVRKHSGLRSAESDHLPSGYFYAVRREDLPIRLWIPEIKKTLILSEEEMEGRPDFAEAEAGNVQFLDADLVTFPLEVRNPGPGDRFQPLGMKGSQKVKDYFINNKIPRRERFRFPAVSDRSGIIFLAGARISERVRLTPGTSRIIKAELAEESVLKNP